MTNNEVKAHLQKHIAEAMQKIYEDSDLGYFHEDLEDMMTEAAFLILLANKNGNKAYAENNE